MDDSEHGFEIVQGSGGFVVVEAGLEGDATELSSVWFASQP